MIIDLNSCIDNIYIDISLLCKNYISFYDLYYVASFITK